MFTTLTVIMKICHVTLQCTGYSVCKLNKMLVIKNMTDLMFLIGITERLNELNVKLQRRENVITS